MTVALHDLAICPTCAVAITRAFVCPRCGTEYPELGGVRCLLPEPVAFRSAWRQRLDTLAVEAGHTIEMFEAELRKPALLDQTRERLETQIALAEQMLREVTEIVLPAAGDAARVSAEIPEAHPLDTYHYLHRDWSWAGESEENETAFGCLERVNARPLGRVLVLGAGAGRLAYDLHRGLQAELTVAVDIDPLVALVARRMVNGGTMELTESRSNATEMSRFGTVRTLKAPHGAVENFHVVLGNALHPPFHDGLFDTVVTPWFIDVVPLDIRDFMRVLDRMLKPCGQWLNFGPLLFPPSRPAAYRYSREEILALAEQAGFALEKETSALVRFAYSPLAERGRLERCIAFSAEKRAPQPGAWMRIPHLPIPDFPGRATYRHPTAAFTAIVALVDGRRSVNDIAIALSGDQGVNLAAMKDAVRLCLQAVHPTA
jgi:hypothetical protein